MPGREYLAKNKPSLTAAQHAAVNNILDYLLEVEHSDFTSLLCEFGRESKYCRQHIYKDLCCLRRMIGRGYGPRR